ncbi:MAG TPA: phosphatase PAP2 family protein [Povalibacter sp.]
MSALAEFIARHALPVLLLIAVITLGVSLLMWRFVERCGPRLWAAAVSAWNCLKRSVLADRVRAVPGLGRALTHTLTAARYLGAYAVISFSLAVAALFVFFELAAEIGVGEDLAQFDTSLSNALAVHLSRNALTLMSWITRLGNKEFLIALAVVVTLLLLLQRRTLMAAWWAVATTAGGLLNVLLKSIFERVRPIHEHGVVVEDGWSFPSGHASGSVLVYGLLGYLLVRYTPPRWHLSCAIACAMLMVFVGFSRVLLQVHYLSDVLAGYASAAAWSALCIAGAEAARWRDVRMSDRLN